MPFPFRHALLFAAVVAVMLIGVALPADAAQTDSSELVIIPEGDVVDEDLYAVANRVIIRGTVDGDLVAIAGQDIRIEGEVTGSVTALGPEVVVTGTIGGSLRVTSPKVIVDGSIGNDLVALSGSVAMTESGSVDDDVVLWAWDAQLLGTIGGGLEGAQRYLSLAGEVVGDVAVSVRKLDIAGPLAVGGDLGYRSAYEATGLDQVTVDGVVVRQEPVPPNIRVRALGLVGRILVAVCLSAVALLVAWAWPERTRKAYESLRSGPVRALLIGLGLFASPLLVVGIGALLYGLAPPAAALPLVGVLIPIFLALTGLSLVVALVAGIPAAAGIGTLMRKNLTIAGAVGLGAALISVVWLIPVAGWLAAALVLTTGLGAWVSSFRTSDDLVQVGETALDS